MSFRYFEDFQTGQTVTLGTYTVSEQEIIEFATRFDPQPFHVDREAAKASIFGGIIASGWHNCALFMRVLVDGLLRESSSQGSPGMDEIRWLQPVRPGDVLTAEYTVLDTVASSSKPDRGVVFSESRVTNGKGQVVMTLRSRGMFGRRPGTSSPA